MNHLLGILTDRERHTRTRESSNCPLEMFPLVDIWRDVIDEAEGRGFEVEISGNYVNFRRGKSYGNFTANEGGTQMAWEFLKGES